MMVKSDYVLERTPFGGGVCEHLVCISVLISVFETYRTTFSKCLCKSMWNVCVKESMWILLCKSMLISLCKSMWNFIWNKVPRNDSFSKDFQTLIIRHAIAWVWVALHCVVWVKATILCECDDMVLNIMIWCLQSY